MATEGATTGHIAGCSAGGMVAQLLVDSQMVKPQTLTLISTTHSVAQNSEDGDQALKPERFQSGRRWMEATARLHDPHHYAGYYESILLQAFRQLTPERAIDLPLIRLQQWNSQPASFMVQKMNFSPLQLCRPWRRQSLTQPYTSSQNSHMPFYSGNPGRF